MRDPESDRGKTPSTCYACRESHPEEGWCNFHEAPHAKSEFEPRPEVRSGIEPECRQAAVIKASRKRNLPPIECVSCKRPLETWQFRGGRQKSPTCRTCESENLGLRWCFDCEAWLPESSFHRTGRDGQFWTVRCKPCKTTWAHGVTYAELLATTGLESPQCGACGSRESLKVDHDHGHCPTKVGCNECVRGWLCHECNTAEGLLRTPERAEMLAAYMRRVAASFRRSAPALQP